MGIRVTPAVCVLALTAAAALGVGLWVGTADAVSHRAGAHRVRAGADGHSGMDAGACAGACMSLYSRQLGAAVTMNAHVPGDRGTGGRAGGIVNVHLARNNRPNEDFTPMVIGRVGQLCGTDAHDFFAPASYACQNDQSFWVFEAQWSPFGNESGLCAGLAVAEVAGENVTLQHCGASTRTLWIGDRANGRGGDCRYPGNYCPWISGTDPGSADPLALTLDSTAKRPADQLRVRPLSLSGTIASDSQEFAYFWGPVT